MGKFTKLDSLIVSCLRDAIPGFQDPPLDAVSQQVDASTVRSYVRLLRPLGDRLFETILFHRTSQARHGILFRLEFVLSYFRFPVQLGPFSKAIALDACLPPGEIEDEVLSWLVGGEWYSLGRTLDECQTRLMRVLSLYEPYVLPVLKKDAEALEVEPSLTRALAIARTITSPNPSLSADVAEQLQHEGLSHPRFSLEFVARDALALSACERCGENLSDLGLGGAKLKL